MNLKQQFILTGSLLSLALFVWAAPAQASEPEVLIDVVEITDPNPFIVHTNILPGDSFLHPMTVRNLTGSPQDVGLKLDIDLSQGIVNIIPYELEEQLFVKIERVGTGFITLPGGGTERTLQELSGTLIELGTIPGGGTQVYKISFVFNRDAGNEYQNTKVYFNVTMGLEVPEVRASLQIFKENDSVGDEAPGNEVGYTLRVKALNGNVNNVELTDLPPKGFAYVSDSGAGAPFIHEYASPGVWNLGDIAAGETKKVTYKTKISNTQDSGLYKDLAWAKGTTGNGDTILAIDPPNSDNFVGTQVAVVTPTSEQVALPEKTKTDTTTKHKTERVLGAAILAATGANGIWIILAGLLAAIGGSLVYFGRRKKIQANSSVKTIMKVFILTLLSLALLGFSGIAKAATPDPNISVRIEDPKSPTDTGTFKIGFVVLDIQRRDLTVKCFKAPADEISNDYVVKAGGNSGNCLVDLPDGTYQFYVEAYDPVDSSNYGQSAPVTVEINTGAPGTPLNYDRANNSCTVTFTTANDGLTSGVELYRSTSLDFTADASTFAQEVAINPNLNGTITDPGPNCGDYYYAIRAVSAGGAGSAFVGDEKVTVKHKTKTQTTTEIINPTATGAISVGGGAVAGGTVGGAETGQGGEQPQGGEGSVLGEVAGETTSECKSWPLWIWLLALAVYGGAFNWRSFSQLSLQKHIRFAWQIVFAVGAVAFWYFFDVCRIYTWFPWIAVIGSIASLGYYIYRFNQTKQIA